MISSAGANAPRGLSPGRTYSSASGMSDTALTVRQRHEVVGVAVPPAHENSDVANKEAPGSGEEKKHEAQDFRPWPRGRSFDTILGMPLSDATSGGSERWLLWLA